MADVFLDAIGTRDLIITTAADWTVSSGGMPNGDNYVTGDGSIAATYYASGTELNLADGTAWSVECWVYYTTAKASLETILKCDNAGLNQGAWELSFNSNETMIAGIINTSSTFYLTASSGTLATNTWHHIAMVKSTGAVLTLYHNTVAVAVDNTTTGTARTPTSTFRVYLGTYGDGTLDINSPTSGLRVAKVAIYNKALSAAELANHYLYMMAT